MSPWTRGWLLGDPRAALGAPYCWWHPWVAPCPRGASFVPGCSIRPLPAALRGEGQPARVHPSIGYLPSYLRPERQRHS